LIIAIAFSPKCPHVSPDSPVDYFPKVESVEPAPIPVVETSLPVETAIATVTTSPVNLENLTSKELKRLARNQKIPKYGSLTKKQLLIALA
jgi:hypothetical protein